MDKIKKIFQSLTQSIAKFNKLSLPAVILIASIILGGFYYASQVNKQRSIERQQEIKMAQEKKEYIAKRKGECYDIHERERKQYNNVENFGYIEPSDNIFAFHSDTCEIIYKDKKTGEYFRNYY